MSTFVPPEAIPNATPTPTPFLQDVRVLALTTALAGPFTTAILADLGAEVITVERPGGDAFRGRRWGPDGVSYPYEMIHRGKSSIVINLRDPRGATIARQLAGKSDVVVGNLRPGALDRLGVGPDQLRAEFPHLIYCVVSGYGLTGPLSDYAGVDIIAQAHSGLMSVTGEEGGRPAKAGFPLGDVGSGLWAAIGLLAALHRRDQTGEGATVDVALLDSLVALSIWDVADYLMSGEVPGPLGSAHRLTAPYAAFRCGDGESIAISGPKSRWALLCETVGAPELVEDERFTDERTRFLNRHALTEALEARLATDSSEAWIVRLRAVGIPCGPILDISQTLTDPHLQARDMWRTLKVGEQEITVTNTPIKADGAPGPQRSAPRVGADTARLLGDLGYDEAAIQVLVDENVVELST